jgi:hypothetical protein
MVTVAFNARVFVSDRRPTERGETFETAKGGRFAKQCVVMMPGTELAATGISLTGLTPFVHCNRAILPGINYFLLKEGAGISPDGDPIVQAPDVNQELAKAEVGPRSGEQHNTRTLGRAPPCKPRQT